MFLIIVDSSHNRLRLNKWKLPNFFIEENHVLPVLETDTEYRERWASIRIIYFTMFLDSLGFSIIITGVWPYLNQLDPDASREFMGYVVAAHPLAQMIFSPLVGWWGNKLKKTRIPCIATLLLFVLASGVYSSIQMFPSNRKYWMLTARFLVGASSANIALGRSYLSSATKFDERTKAVSFMSLAQVLGFIIGPGLQAGLAPLGVQGVDIWKLNLNMYTAPAWISLALGLINLILFCPVFFKEKSIAAKEAMLLSSAPSEKAAWKQFKIDYVTAWTMMIAFFVISINFVLLESLATTLAMDQFAWSSQEALTSIGILLSCGSFFACFTSVAIDKLSKMFGEVRMLIWGCFFLMVLGRVIYIPLWGEPAMIAYKNASLNESLGCPEAQSWCLDTPAITLFQFVLGFILTTLGYPIGLTLIQTIFSKTLGSRPQGVWMGLMAGFGCLSRVVGPVFVVHIYTNYGTIWTFGLTSAMMLVFLLWLWIFRKRISSSCVQETNENDPKRNIELNKSQFGPSIKFRTEDEDLKAPLQFEQSRC